MKCEQTGCTAEATHRFTWPGQPEAAICHPHLRAITVTTLPHLLAITSIPRTEEAIAARAAVNAHAAAAVPPPPDRAAIAAARIAAGEAELAAREAAAAAERAPK